MTSRVWSCGGGTQSAAIGALIVLGRLDKPDLAVIADTGREASETWRYFDAVLSPELQRVGVTIHRVPHSYEGDGYNTVDIFSGADGKTIVIPMHTDKSGKPGILPKFCSTEWKTRPVQRFCREHGISSADFLIGFSSDEMERCRRYDEAKPWNHVYPLIDLRMNRGDCISLVERMGWPTPPRSSCWMCPYRSDAEWRHLKVNDPGDFDSAVKLENVLRLIDSNAYFHKSCRPLGEVDFNDAQEDLFAKPCASGMCFT